MTFNVPQSYFSAFYSLPIETLVSEIQLAQDQMFPAGSTLTLEIQEHHNNTDNWSHAETVTISMVH